MKKLILSLMVIGIAIPAMAASISLVDNSDGTGTIKYTAAADEVLRAMAIVVDAGVETIEDVKDVNPQFNVFMDAMFSDPLKGVGLGTPVADPDAPGEIALGVSKISLCMGMVDQLGGQEGLADDGTYDVATIELSGGPAARLVDLTEDPLRGGIVGDGPAVEHSVGGGNITGEVSVLCACKGDADESNNIDGLDLSAIVGYLHPTYAPGYSAPVPPANLCYDVDGSGLVDGLDLSAIVGFLHPTYAPGYDAGTGVCMP